MKSSFSALSRVGAAGCLAASGVIHAQLYLQGYRVIPGVGPAFLLQASGSLAVALLLLLTPAPIPRLAAAGPIPRLAAAGLAAGALGDSSSPAPLASSGSSNTACSPPRRP